MPYWAQLWQNFITDMVLSMLSRYLAVWLLGVCCILAGCSTLQKSPFDADNAAEHPQSQDLAHTDIHQQDASILVDLIITRAKELLGTPYHYGGVSLRTGFDCSGFIDYLFAQEADISLPRTTYQMTRVKAPLIARSALKPGDIVFFNHRGHGWVSHAGIYIGNNQFIHAASRHSGVKISSLASHYWASSFVEAKRFLPSCAPGTCLATVL